MDFWFSWQSQASSSICVKRYSSAEVSGEAWASLESCTRHWNCLLWKLFCPSQPRYSENCGCFPENRKIHETASLPAIVCTFKVQSRAFISKEPCICTSVFLITCIVTHWGLSSRERRTGKPMARPFFAGRNYTMFFIFGQKITVFNIFASLSALKGVIQRSLLFSFIFSWQLTEPLIFDLDRN